MVDPGKLRRLEDPVEKKRRQLQERLARKRGELPPKAPEPAPSPRSQDAETAAWLEGLAKKTDETGIGSAIELLQLDDDEPAATDEVIDVGEILVRPGAATADSGEIGPAPTLRETPTEPELDPISTVDSGEIGPAPAAEPISTVDSGEIGPAPAVERISTVDSGEIGPAPAVEPISTVDSGEIGPAPGLLEEPAPPPSPIEDSSVYDQPTEPELDPVGFGGASLLDEEGPLKLDELLGGLGGLSFSSPTPPPAAAEPELEPGEAVFELGGILGADALEDDFAVPAGSGTGAVISDHEILGGAAYDDDDFMTRSGEVLDPPDLDPAEEEALLGGDLSFGEDLGAGLAVPPSGTGSVTLSTSSEILGGDVLDSASAAASGSGSDVGTGSGSGLADLDLPPDLELPPLDATPVEVTPVEVASGSSPFEVDDDAMIPLEVMQSSGLLDASGDGLEEDDPYMAGVGVVPTSSLGFQNPGVQELSGTSSDFTSSEDLVPASAIESASSDTTDSDFDLEAAVEGPAPSPSAVTQTALPTPKDHWIPVECTGCGEESSVPRHFAGGIVRCKVCEALTKVPRPGEEGAPRPVARRKQSAPADPEFKRAVMIVLALCLLCVVLLGLGLRFAMR
ncbi:MAG: hypothetical protein R3F62_00420 [Planctomycetota bacterium]